MRHDHAVKMAHQPPLDLGLFVYVMMLARRWGFVWWEYAYECYNAVVS